MKFIDGEKLYHAFQSGKIEVLKRKNHLNKINVFPVPDGDTGTNLAYTMNSIVEGSNASSSVSVVSSEMATAAMLGSRGNSGIIFAQFMQGLHDSVKDKHELSLKDFADSIKRGVDYAYKALSHPVEGTMLTVMKSWSESLHSLHGKAANFTELISNSIEAARTSLKETPKKLKVLKDAGVVDAGGQGFVHFIEGFLQFIKSGIKHEEAKTEIIDITKSKGHSFIKYQKLEYRFCTEGVIKNPNISTEEMRSVISSFGDSDIAAGSKDYFKFHVHTNRPQELFYLLKDYGSIAQSKVDDMQKQFEQQFHRRSEIAIVVDSACDLPEIFLDKHQINIVPINMTFGEHHFLDKLTLTPQQFYKMLDSEEITPQTSQPSVKTFEHLYETLLEHYESVISIHISSKLSGTYNAAKLASEKFAKNKIAVIDSKHLSTSFGLIVHYIAEKIEAGKSFDEICKIAEQLSSDTKLLVAVPSLKYMVRSGRVSPLKGFIAKILNLNPIVSLDENGASTLFGKSFSFEANVKKIIELIRKENDIKPVARYAIGHSNNEAEAMKVADRIEKTIGKKISFIYDIAPVIGVHAGAGAISVSYMSS